MVKILSNLNTVFWWICSKIELKSQFIFLLSFFSFLNNSLSLISLDNYWAIDSFLIAGFASSCCFAFVCELCNKCWGHLRRPSSPRPDCSFGSPRHLARLTWHLYLLFIFATSWEEVYLFHLIYGRSVTFNCSHLVARCSLQVGHRFRLSTPSERMES